MKTIIISLALAAICFAAQAGKNSLKYVITKSDTLICAKLRFGFVNTKCKLNTGEKMAIPYEDIMILGKNNRIKERKPVYLNNTLTDKDELMELIDYKNHIKMFRYECYNNSTKEQDVIISFYKDDKCLNTLTNPDSRQVYDFVYQYTDNDNELLVADDPDSEE